MLQKLRSKISPTQKQLARWAAGFFLVNALLWILIATNYLSLLPSFNEVPALSWQAESLAIVFIVSSFLGYFSLVALVAWLIIGLATFFHAKTWVFVLSIFLGASLTLLLVIDSFVYHLFHFHVWGVVWLLFSAGVSTEVLVLSSKEYLLLFSLILLLLVVELCLAWFVWRLVKLYTHSRHLSSLVYLLIFSFFLSYVLLIKSYAAVQTRAQVVVSTQLINLEAQLIPFYVNVMGLLIPEKEGFIKLQARGGGAFLQLDKKINKLNYPQHALQCKPKSTKPNILIIVVDAMRYEALNTQIMPYLNNFADKAWRFENHYSGGNATGPGIFTLFYGLPYNYWSAMLNERRAPVLMDELQRQGYEMAIYRSASMQYPAFDKTVFSSIKNLQLNTAGNRAYQRDQKITEQFNNFLKNRNPTKPFFGFLFYDALHNYCQRPTPYSQIFQPAIAVCNRAYLNEKSDPRPYLNRYYNAAHFVDELIAQVLSNLTKYQLLNNTIVVITADHGEEFNDSRQNYWGHVSAYTDWQLHVPFILFVPNQKPNKMAHLTTHYDLAPYLLKDVLACTNAYKDYAIGSSLLNPEQHSFFVASSYIDYALITPERITRIYPEGNYRVTDRKALPQWNAELDKAELMELFKEQNRYFLP